MKTLDPRRQRSRRPNALGSALTIILAGWAQPVLSQTGTVGTMGGGRWDTYEFTWTNGAQVEIGDTLRIRTVFINAGDSALLVRAHPCGLYLYSELVFQSSTGMGQCGWVERMLEPGDSIWNQAEGVVAPPTGNYPVRYSFVQTAPFPEETTGGVRTSITVINRGSTDPVRSGQFPTTPPLPKMPVLLKLSGGSSQVDETGVRALVDQVVGSFGFQMLPVRPRAAEAIAAVWPYLVVELALGERGAFRIGTSWVSRVDPFLREMPRERTVSCETGQAGTTHSMLYLGAMLHQATTNAMSSYLGGRCGT